MIKLLFGSDIEGIETKSVPVDKRVDVCGTAIPKMIEIMLSKKGAGLAAPQVGINAKFFIMKFQDTPGKVAVIFDPEYSPSGKSPRKKPHQEGCLSYPMQLWNVPRYPRIKVKYENHKGEVVERKLKGFDAMVFQHETDHLDGISIKMIGSN